MRSNFLGTDEDEIHTICVLLKVCGSFSARMKEN